MYQDQTLTCRDCNETFTWTASEQQFFAEKGFSAPVRCQACRKAKKEQRDGGDRGQGGRSSDDKRPMYEIVCAECGSKGEVPFRPKGTTPVLCVDCYRKKRGDQGGMSTPSHAGTPSRTETPSHSEAPARNEEDEMSAPQPDMASSVMTEEEPSMDDSAPLNDDSSATMMDDDSKE